MGEHRVGTVRVEQRRNLKPATFDENTASMKGRRKMANKLIFMTTLAFAQIVSTIEPRADTCENYYKQWDITAESFNRRCAGELTRPCLIEEAANIVFIRTFSPRAPEG